MRKINKIICCLALPIVSLFSFAGCGNARTSADIKNKFTSIVNEYNHNEENKLFNDGLLDINYIANEMNSVEEDYEKNVHTVVKFENFDDVNLYKRYYALLEVQHKVLKNALVFYKGLSENFFAKAEIAQVSKDDMKGLYNKLEQFGSELATFNVAKEKFEQTVEIMTYSGCVRADLTTYSYSLNNIIEKTFGFVNYFKSLNDKYLFNAEVSDDNKNSYALYYVYEAALSLTEVEYYIYLKAFNNVNECDLSGLVVNASADTTELFFESLREDLHSIIDKDKNITSINCTLDEIKEFEEYRKGFLQKTEIYKQVYNNMNYYEFNKFYISVGGANDKLSPYYDKVSTVEQANINLIIKYYDTTLDDYINECSSLYSKMTIGNN